MQRYKEIILKQHSQPHTMRTNVLSVAWKIEQEFFSGYVFWEWNIIVYWFKVRFDGPAVVLTQYWNELPETGVDIEGGKNKAEKHWSIGAYMIFSKYRSIQFQ